MIKIRAAAALAAGAVAALAVGGAALAADGSDDNSVPMLPNGDVITTPATVSPSPSISDDSASPSPSASDDSASPSPSGSATPGRAGVISMDAARTIALKAAGGGYVESIEPETEHGRAVWDVDVLAGGVEHDIDVDRATGEITRHRTDGSNSSSRSDDDSNRSGDDKGGRHSGGNDDKAGDNHGRHSGGSDDKADDNHGRHGSDDKGGDDNGRRGGDDD